MFADVLKQRHQHRAGLRQSADGGVDPDKAICFPRRIPDAETVLERAALIPQLRQRALQSRPVLRMHSCHRRFKIRGRRAEYLPVSRVDIQRLRVVDLTDHHAAGNRFPQLLHHCGKSRNLRRQRQQRHGLPGNL